LCVCVCVCVQSDGSGAVFKSARAARVVTWPSAQLDIKEDKGGCPRVVKPFWRKHIGRYRVCEFPMSVSGSGMISAPRTATDRTKLPYCHESVRVLFAFPSLKVL